METCKGEGNSINARGVLFKESLIGSSYRVRNCKRVGFASFHGVYPQMGNAHSGVCGLGKANLCIVVTSMQLVS